LSRKNFGGGGCFQPGRATKKGKGGYKENSSGGRGGTTRRKTNGRDRNPTLKT